MRKLGWMALVLAGVIGAILVLTLRHGDELPSASLDLPDGSTVRIVGVTYGTKHEFKSPRALSAETPRTTKNPTILVWLERMTNGGGGALQVRHGRFDVFLADGAGCVSGSSSYLGAILPGGSGNKIEVLDFRMFPRRDPKISLQFYYYRPNGRVQQCGSLSFRNPAPHHYDQWQPEGLPAVKRIGDVEATLTSVHTGYDANNPDRLDGRNNTMVDLKLRSLTNPEEVWTVTDVEVSDATGNQAHNNSMRRNGSRKKGPASFEFAPSLWPGDAWKLKLEIERTEGLKPEDLLTFKNVPLGELDMTNIVSLTTNMNGVKVRLDYIVRRRPETNSSWSSREVSQVRFTNSKLSAGTRLDLISATLDNGEELPTVSSRRNGGKRTYSFRVIPLEAKTADFVFALQQTKSVEFLVKPELP